MVNIKRLDFNKPADSDLLWDAINNQGTSILSLNGKTSTGLMFCGTTYEFLCQLDTVYLVGPYLVAYTIHQPWYSDEDVLCDLLVMRLNSGAGKLSDITDFLEAEARRSNVRFVSVGTLLAPDDAKQVRAYQRCGYEVAATQLIKEIT